MNKKIENIRLKFSCDADWDSMKAIDGIKHCDHCQKKVFDFTDAKQIEFLTVLAENDNNICGKFRREQMVEYNPVSPEWKKWVSAALVLVGINILNNTATAQDKQDSLRKTNPISNGTAFGVVEFEAHFPGGEKAFKEFIATNIHYSPGMKNGRVIASFIVNKAGVLSGFKILRGLNPANDDEALRILKLSPKWTASTQLGQSVKSQYVVAVTFDKAD